MTERKRPRITSKTYVLKGGTISRNSRLFEYVEQAEFPHKPDVPLKLSDIKRFGKIYINGKLLDNALSAEDIMAQVVALSKKLEVKNFFRLHFHQNTSNEAVNSYFADLMQNDGLKLTLVPITLNFEGQADGAITWQIQHNGIGLHKVSADFRSMVVKLKENWTYPLATFDTTLLISPTGADDPRVQVLEQTVKVKMLPHKLQHLSKQVSSKPLVTLGLGLLTALSVTAAIYAAHLMFVAAGVTSFAAIGPIGFGILAVVAAVVLLSACLIAKPGLDSMYYRRALNKGIKKSLGKEIKPDTGNSYGKVVSKIGGLEAVVDDPAEPLVSKKPEQLSILSHRHLGKPPSSRGLTAGSRKP